MTDDQVCEVLQALDELWFCKEKLSEGARAIWGAELSRCEHGQIMRALVALVKTSKWRPSMFDILEAVREGNKRQSKRLALAEAERLALAPAPVPRLSADRMAELSAALKKGTRPTMIDTEPRQACGRTGERRRWGALALDVLTDWLMKGDGAAAEVLDEVARRAAD